MTEQNFEKMTPAQLKQYIRENPKNKDAVHEAAIRIQREGREVTSQEFIEIAKKKLDR